MKLSMRAKRLRSTGQRLARRSLTWLLVFSLGTGCNGELEEILTSQSPEAQAGVRDYQHALLVPVPGGLANAAGGNLFLRPGGLSLESALGPEEVGPVYNSATAEWRFGFVDMTYDGFAFVDHTGARHEIGSLADGAAIPGTVWVRVDAATIRSKGGLVFEFGTQGRLTARRRVGQMCPRILYEYTGMGSAAGIAVRQQDCGTRGEWSTYSTDLFTMDLDANGRIERVVDRSGRTALYTWDGVGNLTRARDGLDVERGWPGMVFAYGTVSNRPILVTNSEGEQIAYEWYSPTLLGAPRLERATRVAGAGEGDLAYRFDYYPGSTEGAYETVVTDPAGDPRRYVFDDARRVRAVAYEAVGEIESFEYEGADLRPSVFVLANGARESYTRDENGDVVSLTRPSGNVVEYEYADANNRFAFDRALRSARDDLGPLGSWEYTQDSPIDYKRLASEANGAGEVTRYDWHPGAGYTRLASVTLPNGMVRSLSEYNPLGQATRIGSGDLADTLTFDEMGNVTAGSRGLRPEIGGVLERRYDADRNPVEIAIVSSDGGAEEIHITRGSDGRIQAIDRPPLGLGVGPDHRFTYDTLGRPVTREERVDGVWQATVFEYDARGQRTAESLPNGMRREWVWDQRGRVVLERALRDGNLEGEIRFEYAGGNLAAVDDSERGRDAYVYDAAGRRSSILYAGGESLEIGYDARSRVVRETYRGPDAALIREIEREYDGADREVGVFDDGELVIERTYVDGQLDCVETGNGLRRCFRYDPALGLRDGAQTTDSWGQVVETTGVSQSLAEYPPRWLISAATEVPGLGSVASDFDIGPASDPDLPITRIGKRVLAWQGSGGATHAYAYDALSNFVDDAEGDVFDYNAEGNRLLEATVDGASVAYTYDAAGYATSRDGVAIEWTATGRMAAYGAYAIDWDMRGQPLRATDSSTGQTTVRDWSRWGGRIDLDGDGALVSLDLGEVVLGFGGERRYRHFDFRGNVAFVSDENGQIVTLYEYDPYGADTVTGDVSDGVRFVGKNRVGPFLWLGERMYDPLVGRFLSPDPVFNLLNQYTYTLGNPVWFSDPTGRDADAQTAHEAMEYATVGLAVAGYALALASLFVATSTLGFAISIGGVVVAAVGLAVTLARFQSNAAPGPNSGCDCQPKVVFGPSTTPAPGQGPAGATPGGTAAESGSIDAGSGGLVAGAFGAIAGGVGFPVACGLTGIEFLLFAAYALARRRRRTIQWQNR